MDLLAHVDGGIVVSELAKGIRIRRGQRDTVVDVEDLGRSALRLDVVGRGDHIFLGVDLAVRPDAAAGNGGLGGAGLGGVRAEVVLAEEGAGDPGLELGVAVIGAVDDCEGVARWVAERQVDLLFKLSVIFQWYKICAKNVAVVISPDEQWTSKRFSHARREPAYTILRAVLDRGSGSNVCLEPVEAECDNLSWSAMSWIMDTLQNAGETYGLVTGDRR